MPDSLNSKIRTSHAVRQIRGTAPAPEAVRRTTQSVAVPAPLPRPRRDGAVRIGAVVTLDPDKRASLVKPLAALGWDAGTPLVAEVDGPTATVRAGKPTAQRPWLVPVRVKAGRITLPPPLVGSLDVDAGDQVLAIALPDTDQPGRGELRLSAAADVLQALTGEVPIDPGTEPTRPAAPAEAPATRVRPAFQAG